MKKSIEYACENCYCLCGFNENATSKDLICPECGSSKLAYLETVEIDEKTNKVVKKYQEQDKEEANPFVELNSKTNKPTQQSVKSTLKCPRCGSTSVATTARGVSMFWGFIGANKTVNRCGNCGYTWKPNGR
jgi:rubrerythrin